MQFIWEDPAKVMQHFISSNCSLESTMVQQVAFPPHNSRMSRVWAFHLAYSLLAYTQFPCGFSFECSGLANLTCVNECASVCMILKIKHFGRLMDCDGLASHPECIPVFHLQIHQDNDKDKELTAHE